MRMSDKLDRDQRTQQVGMSPMWEAAGGLMGMKGIAIMDENTVKILPNP
jgi:hypothetical protein